MKAIAIDIDGTITNKKRFLSLKATKELRKALKHGYRLILCTGNISCFARSTAILIGTDEPVIAENGGVIEKKDGEKIVYGDKDESKRAFRELKKNLDVNRFYEDRLTEVVLEKNVEVEDVKKLAKDFDIDVVDTGFAIHIKPKNTDKGKALLRMCEMIDLEPSDFLAIGDSGNDVGLLNVAGLGVAVANSSDRLKETADKILEQKDGDGVKEALKEFLDYE